MAARSGGGTRADGRATAEQVVAAAERLFAERGVEAVSLREVAKAATSRNTAVAHYHFGGKGPGRRARPARPGRGSGPGADRPADRGTGPRRSLRRLPGAAGRRAAPGAVGGGTGRFLHGQLP